MLHSMIWGIKLEIVSYLTIEEIYILGCCNKVLFLLFLREQVARKSSVVSTARFLGDGCRRESVGIASYPRCGNSFLRKLLENLSGTITGADSHPYRTLSKSLLQCGFQGEGVTDRSVWFIKTHYPERHGYKKYAIDRAILLIRNPFDAIQSYFHMGMTNTHNRTLTPEAFNSLSQIWEPFLLNEIKIFSLFYRWWFQRALHFPQTSDTEHQNANLLPIPDELPKIPILLVRYEDLLEDKESCLRRIHGFLQSGKPPLGLHHFQPPTQQPQQERSSAGYAPRAKKSSPGTSLQTVYSRQQTEQMIQECGDVLTLAGYQITPPESLSSCQNSNYSLQLISPQYQPTSPSPNEPQAGIVTVTEVARSGSVSVNEPFCIRNTEDTFGRKITLLRKSLTQDDTQPFPVTSLPL